MLEPLSFAQASHFNHFDQLNGGKINNWWSQRHKNYSQIYLDSTNILYTFCVTFAFYFFSYTPQGEVWLQSNSITWSKFHHLGQIPSLGTNSLPLQAISHQIRNGRTYNYKLPSTYCTTGSLLKYLTNALPSDWLKSRWRRRRGPPTRSPPWSTVSPGGGSTVWGTLIWSLWGGKWGRGRERNATTYDSPRCILQKQKGIHFHSKENSAV